MIADLRFYLRLLPRRLPVMMVLFLSASVAGVIISQRLPALYATSATLLVESAQISEDLVRTTVQTSASEQLQVIQQRLLTRTNLIEIANEVGVFPGQNRMSADEIVRSMRQSSRIRLTIGRDQATLMHIRFTGASPETVAEVVNRYVDIALETSLNASTSQAEDTLAFFEQEVQKYSDELDDQSAKIAAFKNANADALPENLDYSQRRQSLLQERVSRGERELESLSTQRTNILRVFEATGSVTNEGPPPPTPEERRLLALEGELSVARSVFSESNPRVRSLQLQIDALRAQVEAAAQPATEEEEPAPTPQSTALEISLAEIDSRAETLRLEIADANAELVLLRSSIERTPTNAITLAGLERELDNIQDLYNASVGRLAQARTSLNVIASAKGERITVLEAATTPNAPASPNRNQIAMIGIGAGLGLAIGYFVLLEILNQKIRRPADLVRRFEIVPLASIPRIETAGQKRLRRSMQILASLVVIAAVPSLLWAIDSYYMPLDQLFEKVMNRVSRLI